MLRLLPDEGEEGDLRAALREHHARVEKALSLPGPGRSCTPLDLASVQREHYHLCIRVWKEEEEVTHSPASHGRRARFKAGCIVRT